MAANPPSINAVVPALGAAPFAPSSRYYRLPLRSLTLPDGREVAYVQRRFVPPPDRFQTVMKYTVIQNDRLDQIAARVLGDPLLFWQLSDANGAMDPDELTTTPGRQIRVTLPEGVSGPSSGQS